MLRRFTPFGTFGLSRSRDRYTAMELWIEWSFGIFGLSWPRDRYTAVNRVECGPKQNGEEWRGYVPPSLLLLLLLLISKCTARNAPCCFNRGNRHVPPVPRMVARASMPTETSAQSVYRGIPGQIGAANRAHLLSSGMFCFRLLPAAIFSVRVSVLSWLIVFGSGATDTSELIGWEKHVTARITHRFIPDLRLLTIVFYLIAVLHSPPLDSTDTLLSNHSFALTCKYIIISVRYNRLGKCWYWCSSILCSYSCFTMVSLAFVCVGLISGWGDVVNIYSLDM